METKVGSHIRSPSWPSTSHPVTENLNVLRASEIASTSSVCQKLNVLEDLYECVDDMLQLSVVQQALANFIDMTNTSKICCMGLRVLDVCGSNKYILSHMKESVQNFESSVRRKRGESVFANEIENYMNSRKISKKVCKIVRNLKETGKKNSSELLEKDSDLLGVVSILKEGKNINLSVFESVLSSISESGTRSKTGSWFSVSKLIRSKRIACEAEAIAEDVTLNSIYNQKLSKRLSFEQLQAFLKPLEALESCIQDFEDGLEKVNRRLVKTSLPCEYS